MTVAAQNAVFDQCATSQTSRGSKLSRNFAVSSLSNKGSFDSMHRKNRFLDALTKRSTLNTGWYGIGNPFNPSMPRTATNAATRIVISKVTGMNDGQLNSGRPPTLMG